MRHVALGVLFLVSLAGAQTSKFTIEEIAKHNSEERCWLIIDNKVYDVTTYIPKHPAPKRTILDYCGKDATQAFKTKEKNKDHSKRAKKLLESFLVGEIEL